MDNHPVKPELDYVFGDQRPEGPETFEVAKGVYWIRMAIPIPGLDYINLWLLEDDDGWTIVDTGLRSKKIMAWWEEIFASKLMAGRPVKRVICTHFHTDHLGQAGWLTERWGCLLWMSLGEWAFGRTMALDVTERVPDDVVDHYRRIGYSETMLEALRERGFNRVAKMMTPIPRAFRRLTHDQRFKIGQNTWRVIIGRGHSPEHVALFCENLNVLISGDQILPAITPHIGVYPAEPDANPLQLYLETLDNFRPLPDDVMILPAHGDPFRNLHARINYLQDHHRFRLKTLWQAAPDWVTVRETLPFLFRRELQEDDMSLAFSEAISHIHMLIGRGRMERKMGDDGVYRYRSTGLEAA
ncbi:MAG: MBL fold metallo-hydrolase [Minwuia sp.]|uniref:MBL fold metallo-hydrolase n=1 Tax=Minwuia sp. TaxID=2493630 RepID=UPI003A86517E